MAASMASLFEGHPLAMQHLTPNLLRLYVDIEFTGSHTAVCAMFCDLLNNFPCLVGPKLPMEIRECL